MSGETTLHADVVGARRADRLVYVFMAALFIATAIVGFAPTSSALIAAVASGERPTPPLFLHFHAVSMSAWLALLLVQTSLVAGGRSALHRKLGMASLVAAPAVVISLTLMTVVPAASISQLTAAELTTLHIDVDQVWGFIVTQIRAIVLFALFAGWAFAVRRTDSETHKRMMIVATAVPLNAALSRMIGVSQLLPGAGLFESHLVPDFYQVLLLTPVLIYDVVRFGRVHRAYVIGVILLVSTMIAAHFLSDADWWLAIGHDVMGGGRL
jgi:hypothetical protein